MFSQTVAGGLGAGEVALLAAGIAAATSLVALLGGHFLESRRSRRRWLDDRRLDAYCALLPAIDEVSISAGMVADVGRAVQLGQFPPEQYNIESERWKARHVEFIAAQHRASLIAGDTVLEHIVSLSKLTFNRNDLINAARDGAVPVDDFEESGAAIRRARDLFVKAARAELKGSSPGGRARLRRVAAVGRPG